jgi:hypothetical protein
MGSLEFTHQQPPATDEQPTMNSIHTRRAAAFFCATVATLALFVGADMVAAQNNSSALAAAQGAGTPAAQVLVINGQRASCS